MSILAWILLGLLPVHRQQVGQPVGRRAAAGYLAGNGRIHYCGWLFNAFGEPGVTGFNIYSLLVATIGSVVFLMLYHALRRA